MGLNILIADDNCDAVDTLARLVGFWGHDARVAYDGLGALHEARRYPFDVGLFDVGMPKLDGYGLARQLRQEQTDDETFLIAITAYSGQEFEQQSANAGFDLHLVKPVAPPLLRETLAIIDGASAQRLVFKYALEQNRRLRLEMRKSLAELCEAREALHGWEA
jgi:CheY-like chemotaxis protein